MESSLGEESKSSFPFEELKIGNHSFEEYSVCEMENLPSLEVIQIGNKNEDSWNFYYASLELKGE